VKKPQLVWIVLVVAFLLRLPLLNGSFWLDEAAQALESVRPFSEQLKIAADFQPPLLHYLVHFATQVTTNEWWLRLWGALIPGLVTIWATYLLGKQFFSEKVGLISALLLTTSSFHIFYSQELRPYSLPAMWAILSTLLLFKKKFVWWQFALVSLLGLYSSYLYAFFLLPQLYFVWRMKFGWQQVLKITVATGVFFAPWLPSMLEQIKVGQALRLEIPSWESVVSTPQLKALALVPLKFLFGVLNVEPNLFFIVTALILFAVGAYTWRKWQPKQAELIKLLILFITPIATSWLVSFVIPVVQPKRLLFLLPLFYLLATGHLAVKINLAKLAWLLPILLLLLNLWSTFQYWTQPNLQRENWRGLKEAIMAKFSVDQTLVVFSFNEAFAPWRWYYPDQVPTLTTGKRQIDQVADLTGQLRTMTDYQYVLVFDYLRDLTDPDDKLIPAVESFGFTGRGVLDYPGIGLVRIYSQREFTIGYNP
jgi:uncharacterized membrane protein